MHFLMVSSLESHNQEVKRFGKSVAPGKGCYPALEERKELGQQAPSCVRSLFRQSGKRTVSISAVLED